MIKRYLFLLPFFSFIAGYFFIQFFFTTKELQTPQLIGKNLIEACEVLSDLNLNIRILAHKEDTDQPPNTIISQTPQPNEKIKPQQSVYLVLTSQSPAKQAPSLINKPPAEITAQLTKLDIQPIVYFVPSPYPKNSCIAQSPRPNEMITKNKITIYCSMEHNKPIIWPDFTQKPLGIVKELLENAQIQPQIIHNPGHYRHEISDECIVIDQRPLAGTLLTLESEKSINVQLCIS